MYVSQITVHDRAVERYKRNGRSRFNYRDYEKAPRIFVSVDESIFDNLSNRFSRPYKAYAAIVITPALTALALDPAMHTARWSQKAGCSCGCSPAFIISSTAGRLYLLPKKDVWIHISGSNAAVDPAKGPRDLGIATSSGMVNPSNTEELINALLNQ